MAAVLAQNGSYQGAMQAILLGRPGTATSEGSYASQAAAALALSQEVATLVTCTSADQQALLANITAAFLAGRPLTDTVEADYNKTAQQIVAAYSDAVGGISH